MRIILLCVHFVQHLMFVNLALRPVVIIALYALVLLFSED